MLSRFGVLANQVGRLLDVDEAVIDGEVIAADETGTRQFEVLDFLREYHGVLGPLVSQFEGTLDQFSGDGIMVFFNDPVPCPDPGGARAVKMAMPMREEAGKPDCCLASRRLRTWLCRRSTFVTTVVCRR
jgi:hypothetical protein